MTDPEATYRRLVSGDAGAVRDRADDLRGVIRKVDGARDDIDAAADVPVWTGAAALAFEGRVAALAQGATATATIVLRARGALTTAARAYADCVDRADELIAIWRNRPDGLPAIVEQAWRLVVHNALVRAGDDYGTQLAGITGVLKGEDVDLDELDFETREWVEQGLEKNEDWLNGNGNGSGLGPLIPNTAATGDGRGLTPQGLGYDPRNGLLLQGYYHADEEGSGLALIDERTGKEISEVTLGDDYRDPTGRRIDDVDPNHAGGVTVDGDDVYVTDDGRLHTYSLSEIRNNPGGTVQQTVPSQTIEGGAYSTFHDGKLYVGKWQPDGDSDGEMYVYQRNPQTGEWVQQGDPIPTPGQTQGVVVRDGEYVFSTSWGRGNESALIVRDFDNNPVGDPDGYPLPNMSQGVVEVDGDLITSYESGARKFDDDDDPDELWANPYMTRTPLDELGLTEDVEVEPGSLDRAADDLGPAATTLADEAATLDGVRVPASLLGPVAQASELTTAVNGLLEGCAKSLRTGSQAVRKTADELRDARRGFADTDAGVAGWMSPGSRGPR